MDQRAKERIEAWTREIEAHLGAVETALATLGGALDEPDSRKAIWRLAAQVSEARDESMASDAGSARVRESRCRV